MEANYMHKDSTTLEEKSQVFTRWIYPTIKELKQENQELKQKYLNAVSDYETTMFEKEQLNNLVNSCQEEIRQLKKQLEEYQLQNINLIADIMIQKMAFPNKLIKDKTFYDLYDMPTYEDLLNQQKEFINYLENMLDSEHDIFSVVRVKDVLQKYKSIIGDVKNENK